MAAPKTYKLILTGWYTGKNAKLNGYDFINGACTLIGTSEGIQGAVTYFGKTYQAFLEGSDELAVAQARDAANKAGNNGKRDLSEGPGDGVVQGEVQPDGRGPTETPAEIDSGDDDVEGGDTVDIPAGDGHEDTGVPGPQESGPHGGQTDTLSGSDHKLQQVIYSLDADEDDHWTALGLPKMAVIELAMGSTGFTRKDIERCAPGYDRDAAREIKDLS